MTLKSERGKDEANSPFGQYTHDYLHVPGQPGKFDFWVRDVDSAHYCRDTRIERWFESKWPRQSLKPSQWDGLKRDAIKVERMVATGELAAGSGVWVVWFDDDAKLITELRRMRSSGRLESSPFPWSIRVEALHEFIRCRGPLPAADEVRAYLVEGQRDWSLIAGPDCRRPGCAEASYTLRDGVSLCALCNWKVGQGLLVLDPAWGR